MYRLALALGEPHVEGPGSLAERMSAEQFEAWRVYYEVEPWGEERADLRAGINSAAMGASGDYDSLVNYMDRIRETDDGGGQSERMQKAILSQAVAIHNAKQKG